MEADMSNELHWGGINGKSLIKAVASDIWMVFAVMIISYIGLGIVGNMMYTPSYTSDAIVAVYPFNQMYTLEASSSARETVGAVNEVLNSEMFKTGLETRLAEPADFSLDSRHINGTYILMLSASCSTPENAYLILQAALDYYGEISSRLVGDSYLEILTEPDFPTSASNSSKILENRLLLTLFMGFAMAGFLVLMYVVRKTYKSADAIQNSYKNIRFFRVTSSASGTHNRKNKRRSGKMSNQETVRKTALELMQTLRAKKGKSIFITSAAHNEGKMEVTTSLAREMAGSGKSVLILETDTEDNGISEHLDVSDDLLRYTLSEFLQSGEDFESASDIPDQRIKIIYVNNISNSTEDQGLITRESQEEIKDRKAEIPKAKESEKILDAEITKTELETAQLKTIREDLKKSSREIDLFRKQQKEQQTFLDKTPDNLFHRKERKAAEEHISGIQRQIESARNHIKEILKQHGFKDVKSVETAFMEAKNKLQSLKEMRDDMSDSAVDENSVIQDDKFSGIADDIKKTLKQAETFVDIVLIDGCIWNESENNRIWREAADTSLAICRQDKADFYAIDSMMTDLQENDPGFLGCVLYGF